MPLPAATLLKCVATLRDLDGFRSLGGRVVFNNVAQVAHVFEQLEHGTRPVDMTRAPQTQLNPLHGVSRDLSVKCGSNVIPLPP